MVALVGFLTIVIVLESFAFTVVLNRIRSARRREYTQYPIGFDYYENRLQLQLLGRTMQALVSLLAQDEQATILSTPQRDRLERLVVEYNKTNQLMEGST